MGYRNDLQLVLGPKSKKEIFYGDLNADKIWTIYCNKLKK